jgi:hypothetical protein
MGHDTRNECYFSWCVVAVALYPQLTLDASARVLCVDLCATATALLPSPDFKSAATAVRTAAGTRMRPVASPNRPRISVKAVMTMAGSRAGGAAAIAARSECSACWQPAAAPCTKLAATPGGGGMPSQARCSPADSSISSSTNTPSAGPNVSAGSSTAVYQRIRAAIDVSCLTSPSCLSQARLLGVVKRCLAQSKRVLRKHMSDSSVYLRRYQRQGVSGFACTY